MLKLEQILQKFHKYPFIYNEKMLSSKTSFGAQQNRYDLIQNFKKENLLSANFDETNINH